MSVSIKPFFFKSRKVAENRSSFAHQSARVTAVLSTGLCLMHPCLADGRNSMVPISSASLEVKDSSVSSKDEFLVPGFERLTATRERPLFTPSRHQPLPPPPPPVKQVEAPPPPPPAPPPNVSLLGTVLSADPKEAFAVIKGSDGNKTRHVAVGDEVENWKIAQIEAQQIVLSLEERSVTIKLASDKPALSRQVIAPPPFPPQPFGANIRPDLRARRFNGGLPQQQ